MIIKFNKDRSSLLFQHSTPKEYTALSKFPAFTRDSETLLFSCPTTLPVAYNIVERCKKYFSEVVMTKEVKEWLDSPFKLRDLPESFSYHTSPEVFQGIALRFLYTLGSAGLLLDPGMGKSKIVLDYIHLKEFGRSLIVCPAALLFVWEDEIRKHRPELSFHVIRTTDWAIELPRVKSQQVIITNYTKAVILKHRLKETKFDFMHVDEFLIKDPSSDRTKALTEISRGIPYRCGGSGTLINNSPFDAFSPIRYLQPSLLGWNYSNFLDRYSVTKEINLPDGSKRKMIVAHKKRDEIKAALESCNIVMTKSVWLKLPPKHFHDLFVKMGEDQKEAFYTLLRNYRLDLTPFGFPGEEINIDNPLTMLSKLYQISQGFLYFNREDVDISAEDELRELLDETKKSKKKSKKSDRRIVYFKAQPKIERLERLLREELLDKKCIIWYNLDSEYTLIEKSLGANGESFLSIRGGDKGVGDKVREFNLNPSIRRLVCQAKSVNYGITVLGQQPENLENDKIEVLPSIDPSVHNQVFYSINFSLEVYLQQLDRIHRLGQKKDCHYYRIFSDNPIEEKLRKAIDDKLELKMEMLVDVFDTFNSRSN